MDIEMTGTNKENKQSTEDRADRNSINSVESNKEEKINIDSDSNKSLESITCSDKNEVAEKKKKSVDFEGESKFQNFLAGVKSDLDEIPDDVDADFANTTSLHGVQHFVKEKSPMYKFGWLLIFLTCVFICMYQMIDRLSYYFSYPTSRDIEVQEASNLLFPAVTMCSVFRYNNNTISDVDRQFMKLTRDYFEATHEIQSNYTEEDLSILMERLNKLYEPHEKFNFTAVMLRTAYQIDHTTLKYCRFGGKKCHPENFRLSFNFKYQLCWTFNAESKPLNQLSPGSDYGFKFSLDLKEKDYVTLIPSPRLGLKAFFHPPYEHPYVFGSGYAFGPGLQTRATVSYQINKNMPYPYGLCDKKQGPMTGFRNYSLSNCLLECTSKVLIEYCKCRPLYYPGGGIIEEPCDFQDLDCITNHSDPNRGIYSDVEKQCKKQCKVGCEEEYFFVVLSYVQLVDNQNFKSAVELYGEESGDYIRKNYLFLNVYYEEFLHTVTEQKRAISFSALISDIGGQMGLFLGISILTIIEIFEYCGRRTLSEINVRVIKKRQSKDGKYAFIGKHLISAIGNDAKAHAMVAQRPNISILDKFF